MSLLEAAEFVRRQYLQVRIYTPIPWAMAFVTSGVSCAAYWGSALVCLTWLFNGGLWWAPACFALAYYAINRELLSIRMRTLTRPARFTWPAAETDTSVWFVSRTTGWILRPHSIRHR